MSLHAQLSPEALARLQAQQRNSTITSVIVSILLVLLIGIVLMLLLLPPIVNHTPDIVAYYGALEEEEKLEKRKLTRAVQPKPAAPSSAMAKVIAANNPSPLAIPVPEFPAEVPSVDFGDGDDFGSGFGNGWGDGFGDGTKFGRPGGGGLVGSFYDLKQKPDGKPTKWGEFYAANPGVGPRLDHMMQPYRSLTRSKFNKSSLRKYFKADAELSFTNLVIQADTSAVEAPRAFQVEGLVKPSGWAVVYEGTLDAPKSGTYQFCGYFDDILLVYIDGKLVLDGSFSEYSSFQKNAKPGPAMRVSKPVIMGKPVKLSRNHKIKIVVAESPGGHMGGGLFIRQQGVKYRTANGGEVLPPFTTEPLSPQDKDRMQKIQIMGGKGLFPIEVENVPVFRVRR